jgi:uroporphyrinogen decarboxylase
MNGRERMLAASRCGPVDRPPVWLMRQAGRYLPEYRELRKRHDFWEVLRTPWLATEIALQPLRRFDLDAAILFSDLLVPLDAMGAEVSYGEGGPVIARRFGEGTDLHRIERVDVRRDLAFVGEAVDRLCEAVHPEKAVIGFAGAPLTLASYLVDGSHRGEPHRLAQLLGSDPERGKALLDALADVATELLLAQIDAGADVVQVFDSASPVLSPREYADLALPPLTRMIRRIEATGTPVALYFRNAAGLLDAAAGTGCQVLSIDSSLSMWQARSRVGPSRCLQGNIDPALLLGPRERIKSRVREVVTGSGARGLVVNVGRGLFPGVPVEGVAALVDAVIETEPEEAHGAVANEQHVVLCAD